METKRIINKSTMKLKKSKHHKKLQIRIGSTQSFHQAYKETRESFDTMWNSKLKSRETHTHTHTHIYVCMYVCMYVLNQLQCVLLLSILPFFFIFM